MIYLKSDDILLFQGDSITHGGRGLSKTDMNHVIGHGYQASLTGRMMLENMDRMPQIYNRGVSGDNTRSVLKRIDEDLIGMRPTVLSILIGVNNINAPDPDPRVYREELSEILAQVKEALPLVKLIICEPFCFDKPSYEDEEDRKKWQHNIELVTAYAAIAKEKAEEYGAVFVPFHDELEKYYLSCPPASVIWDGVHPTVLGHEIMYRFWYDVVDKSGILAR